MKKILLSLVAVGMIATNANAWWITQAKAEWLQVASNGSVFLRVKANGTSYNYSFSDDNDEAHKAMIASGMTALASGMNVSLEIDNAQIVSLYLLSYGM